jgi:hypothetical protein
MATIDPNAPKAITVGPNVPDAPAIEIKPRGPSAPAPEKAGKTGLSNLPAARPSVSGFQRGPTGLPGKFTPNPLVNARAFASSPGHKIGLNRPSDVLGPNKFTVGQLLDRLEEHNPTPDLLNGAFNVLGANN